MRSALSHSTFIQTADEILTSFLTEDHIDATPSCEKKNNKQKLPLQTTSKRITVKMRFLTPIFTLACFASTSLALNCKGSSECHWTMRHDLMDELVAWIDDEHIYAAGERIL